MFAVTIVGLRGHNRGIVALSIVAHKPIVALRLCRRFQGKHSSDSLHQPLDCSWELHKRRLASAAVACGKCTGHMIASGFCRRGAARVIELQNPARANAMSPSMMDALQSEAYDLRKQCDAAVQVWRLEGDTIASPCHNARPELSLRRILIRGAGSAFCSGADLSVVDGKGDSHTPREFGVHMHSVMREALSIIGALPVPSFSEVSGAAVGGGTELALATDFRLWGARGGFRMVQARMGVGPGWGGGDRLAARVGFQAAKRLLLSGSPVSVRQAISLGLADAVEDSGLTAADRQLASDMAVPMVSGSEADAQPSAEGVCECGGACKLPPWVLAGMEALAPLSAAAGPTAACKSSVDPEAARVEFLDVWGGSAQLEALERRRRRPAG